MKSDVTSDVTSDVKRPRSADQGCDSEESRDELITDLVGAVARGNQEAWRELVQRFTPRIIRVAQGCGLSHSDANDVSQATWLKLFENVNRIRKCDGVGAWLTVTARRESFRVFHRRRREVLTGDQTELPPASAPSDGPWSPEHHVLASERATVLRRAVEVLPPQHQRFVQMLMLEPPATYREIAEATGMPVGSIGPTRARCLQRLRGTPDLAHLGSR